MGNAALPTLTDVEAQRIKTLGYKLTQNPKPGDTTVPALPDDLIRKWRPMGLTRTGKCVVGLTRRVRLGRGAGTFVITKLGISV